DQVAEVRRVAILDYDAHHGNGTRDIFADSASVLYVSTHEYGIFPGTGPAEDIGTGEGRGFTVNIPFSAGCGDTSYRAAYDRAVEPIVEQFRPDVVLVSLGVDPRSRRRSGPTDRSGTYVDAWCRFRSVTLRSFSLTIRL